jgi:hypothetical protein
MDDEPRRLVDHDQVGIFVNDRQRNILGHRLAGAASGTRMENGTPGPGLDEACAATRPATSTLPSSISALIRSREARCIRQRPVKPQPTGFEHARDDLFGSPMPADMGIVQARARTEPKCPKRVWVRQEGKQPQRATLSATARTRKRDRSSERDASPRYRIATQTWHER